MSITRIWAVIIQELYITKHSLEVIIDLFYFSVINIVIFGFVSIYLTSKSNTTAAQYILMGMILWEIIRISQYSISVGSLWNIWSRNLSNMFVAPLLIREYMIAEMINGGIKALIDLTVISIICNFVFHFNIFSIGITMFIVAFINLIIFGWAAGIFIVGLIFRYGTRISALAWGLIFLFQPITAVFFPVNVLPSPLRQIAYTLPPTYVFENARAALTNHSVNWTQMNIALGENIIIFILTLLFFNYMFRKSKESGQFARNEG